MFTEAQITKFRKAGQVSAEALAYGAKLIKPGASVLETVEKIEDFILSKEAGFAFPVNVSMNSAAAHDTAFPDDKRVFSDEVVKLDLGAQYDGYSGDTAVTIDLSGKHAELVKASRDALNEAISLARPGITLGEIGKAIEEIIESRGFQPVRNLSGHQIGHYNLHCGLSIPNYATGENTELEEGMVIAIEPFATDGAGMIAEKGVPGIFSQVARRPVRNPAARKLLMEIEKYGGLPFSTRWLTNKFQKFQLRIALNDLLKNGIIRGYAPLVERTEGLVSQAEHTVLVKDKPYVLTVTEQ